MKKIFKWVGIVVGLWIVAALIWSGIGGGGSDSKVVALVKEGNIQMCPQYTVGQLATSFMQSPSWESIRTENGNDFVNLRGGITLQGKPVDAVAQFAVNLETGAFTFKTFELNGIPQNDLVKAELIQKMCASASN